MAPADERHKVLEGRDGFLFLTQDTNDLLAQHAGTLRFTDAQLEQWRELLERRIERTAAIGAPYVFAVAPNTHSVYPENLPPGIDTAPHRPIHQLIEHLEQTESPARVLYPEELLAAHKSERQMFLRVDTHWTDRGAFLVYRSLVEPLEGYVPMRVLGEDDIFFTQRTITGDLGSKLEPPRTEVAEVARVANHAAHSAYDNCVDGTGSVIVTRCETAPPGTCVLLGDSYSYALLRFLPETFRRLVFVQRPALPPDLLEREQPDVVISVTAERFLLRVPDDEHAVPQREVEDQKRTRGRVRSPQTPFGRGPDFASPAQVEDVRSRMVAAGSLRDATIVSLMAYAALGPADVMALRWRAVQDGFIELDREERPRRVPLWDVVAQDIERWRSAAGADVANDDPVFAHLEAEWGIRDWGDWRAHCYAPVMAAVGLRRLRPWSLHNTYVHLRLAEGADAAQVTAETGVATSSLAVARARAALAGDGSPVSADDLIRAARAAAETPGAP
jgi:alginate O-acetyltransferase complex protein AlgJ